MFIRALCTWLARGSALSCSRASLNLDSNLPILQVPAASAHTQGERNPCSPSSGSNHGSAPLTKPHPPPDAKQLPMCGPPSAPLPSQALLCQVPPASQAPQAQPAAGSSGFGFKKGLKAKWMQDTEQQDRTRKEKDEEEVGQAKLVSVLITCSSCLMEVWTLPVELLACGFVPFLCWPGRRSHRL